MTILRRLDAWLRLSRLNYPVPEHGRSFFFSLGGVVFSGFLFMILTGFILAQFYHPLPEQSYQSIEGIERVGWTSYLRALHYWTAQGIVLAITLHMIRVFITGAYKRPRQVTWWIGVALLATMIMGSYFSGTILKWDQEGSDALHHYQETLRMLGPFGAPLTESLPGSAPMNLRIYVSHIVVFPILLTLLVVAHFYLIHVFNLSPTPWDRWSGVEEIPAKEIKGKFNEHARSIVILSALYYGILAIVAFFVRAPLLDPPSGSQAAVKPPWPFLWMYGLENAWGIAAILYASLAFFAFLFLVPFIDRKQDRRWPARKGILILGAFVCLSLIGLSFYGWIAPAQIHGHGPGHSEGEMIDHSDPSPEPSHETGTHDPSPAPADTEKNHPHDPETPSDHLD